MLKAALLNEDGRDEAVELLEQDASPNEIIDIISSPDFDKEASNRQYGVVDLNCNAVGYT